MTAGRRAEGARGFECSEDQRVIDLHAHGIGVMAGEDAVIEHASAGIDAGFDQHWAIDSLNLIGSGRESRWRIERRRDIVCHFGTGEESDEYAEHNYCCC